jgi:zinc protease
MDNSESIGAILANYVHFERTPETLNDLYRSYDAVTPEDVLAAANRYFVDRGRTVVTLAHEDPMVAAAATPSLDERVAAYAAGEPVELEVVAMPSASSPLVDVSFVFHAGAADDPPGKHGLAALTAAMITGGGSESRSIQEINDARYPMAATFDAQVDKEMTRLAGTVHTDNLAAWYRLAREQLLSPGWREDDLERLKTRQINAVRTDLVGNNDEELGKEVLYQFIYGEGHPYGSLNEGATDEIARLTMADVKAFYEAHYARRNLTLGLAGGYDEAFAQRLEEDLGRLPSGKREAVDLPRAPSVAGHSARIVEKETPAVAVSFGFPIDVRRGDDDWVALWLARSWLGEHRNSGAALYHRIREVRGMNYGDYAYVEYFPRGMFQFYPDPNLGRRQQIFQVWLRPLRDNNDAHFATRAALYEMQKLLENGLSEPEFEATRNFLDKYVSLLTKTQSRQLGYGIDSAYYSLPAFAEYVRAGLEALTPESVNRAIRRHLRTDDVRFVFVTADAADLRRRLLANEPSPIEYNSPKPDELLEEDRIIAQLPLSLSEERIETVQGDALFR